VEGNGVMVVMMARGVVSVVMVVTVVVVVAMVVVATNKLYVVWSVYDVKTLM
jgi:hypothetical protein